MDVVLDTVRPSPGRITGPDSAPVGVRHETWRDKAAALAGAFAEQAAGHDRDASFPTKNFEALHASGLLTLTVPHRYGGPEATLADVASVIQHIAQGDASTALVLLMNYVHTASALRSARWPASLQQRFAQEALERVTLINALRVERELGTPARGGLPATTAERTENGWRINGRKIYSTGSPALRYGMVWVRTDEATPRVGFVLVPMNASGVRIETTWDHLGMRASGSHDVILDGVTVPLEYAVDLRDPGDWTERDPVQAVWSTALICTLYNGVATAARDWLVWFLRERRPANLGASLATLPRMQTELGRIEANLFANRVLLDRMTKTPDDFPVQQAGIIKHIVTGNAIKTVSIALELTGNAGLSRANPLERYHRDVLCSRIHTPQDDVILLGAGRLALGI